MCGTFTHLHYISLSVRGGGLLISAQFCNLAEINNICNERIIVSDRGLIEDPQGVDKITNTLNEKRL